MIDTTIIPENACFVNLNAALDYARRGFHVFPLCWPNPDGACGCGRGHQGRDVGKAPLTPHGLLDATKDPKQVRYYWCARPDANIGLVCGTVSGLIVLDIDGAVGNASLQGKPLPATPTVMTGKGKHVYLKHPGGMVKNAVALLPGVDLRGDGGYVVAPPSTHLSSRRYRWAEGLSMEGVPLADCPDWLLELAKRKSSATQGGSVGRTPEEWYALLSQTILEGRRNSVLASLAGKLFRHYIPSGIVLYLLTCVNEARCKPPLGWTEVAKIVNSIAGIEARRRGLVNVYD